MARVELLYWEGCPSWEDAARLVRAEMERAGLDPDRLQLREVESDKDAAREGFIGSPTIRVDGRDVEDPGGQRPSLSCRVYRLRDGRISALPDPDSVAAAIEAAAQGGR